MAFARSSTTFVRIYFGFACACLLFFAWRENVKLRAVIAASSPPPVAEDAVRWNPLLARVLSFGQTPAVIDWMWLRLLQDGDLSHIPKGKHPSIYYDLILGTELDPAYFDAYVVGSELLSIVRDDNAGALELVKRAETFAHGELPALGPVFAKRFWNPPWRIPMIGAYLELFEFNDLPDATVQFKEAAAVPGSPAYLQHLVGRLSTRAGQFEVGASLLQFMVKSAEASEHESPAKLEALRQRVRDFQISRYLFQVNERFDAFLKEVAHKQPRLAGDPAAAFARFLVTSGESGLDPEGGQLKLDAKGRIITTTPHNAVLGLEE